MVHNCPTPADGGCSSIPSPRSLIAPMQDDSVFYLKGKPLPKTLCLKAETEAEKKRWCTALKKVLLPLPQGLPDKKSMGAPGLWSFGVCSPPALTLMGTALSRAGICRSVPFAAESCAASCDSTWPCDPCSLLDQMHPNFVLGCLHCLPKTKVPPKHERRIGEAREPKLTKVHLLTPVHEVLDHIERSVESWHRAGRQPDVEGRDGHEINKPMQEKGHSDYILHYNAFHFFASPHETRPSCHSADQVLTRLVLTAAVFF